MVVGVGVLHHEAFARLPVPVGHGPSLVRFAVSYKVQIAIQLGLPALERKGRATPSWAHLGIPRHREHGFTLSFPFGVDQE